MNLRLPGSENPERGLEDLRESETNREVKVELPSSPANPEDTSPSWRGLLKDQIKYQRF